MCCTKRSSQFTQLRSRPHPSLDGSSCLSCARPQPITVSSSFCTRPQTPFRWARPRPLQFSSGFFARQHLFPDRSSCRHGPQLLVSSSTFWAGPPLFLSKSSSCRHGPQLLVSSSTFWAGPHLFLSKSSSWSCARPHQFCASRSRQHPSSILLDRPHPLARPHPFLASSSSICASPSLASRSSQHPSSLLLARPHPLACSSCICASPSLARPHPFLACSSCICASPSLASCSRPSRFNVTRPISDSSGMNAFNG